MTCSCNAGEGCMCMYEDLPATRVIAAEVTDEMVERAAAAILATAMRTRMLDHKAMARAALAAAFKEQS